MATSNRPLPTLGSRLERLLSNGGPPFGRPRLTADELASLRELLARGARQAQPYNIARAMEIVTDNAPDARTAQLLGRVLKDPQAAPALRRQAAASLGELPLRSAGRALADALAQAPGELEPTLLQALAKVGTADDAAVLARRPAADSPGLRRLRRFAQGVMRARAGLPPSTGDGLLPVSRPLALTPMAEDERAATVAGWRGSRFGVALGRGPGWRVDCAGTEHRILLADAWARKNPTAWLMQAERLAGVVAMADGERQPGYVGRRLIVTQPDGDRIRVGVLRLDGQPELMGELRLVDPGRLSLEMRSTAAAARPMAVTGTVGEGPAQLGITAYGDAFDQVARHGQEDPQAA